MAIGEAGQAEAAVVAPEDGAAAAPAAERPLERQATLPAAADARGWAFTHGPAGGPLARLHGAGLARTTSSMFRTSR